MSPFLQVISLKGSQLDDDPKYEVILYYPVIRRFQDTCLQTYLLYSSDQCHLVDICVQCSIHI